MAFTPEPADEAAAGAGEQLTTVTGHGRATMHVVGPGYSVAMRFDLSTLTDSELELLQILQALAELSGNAANQYVSVAALKERLTGHGQAPEILTHANLELLKSNGWALLVVTYAGVSQVALTPQGVADARDLDAELEAGVTKSIYLRNKYLRWLYVEIEQKDRGPTPDDFLATNPAVLGYSFTKKEVERAGKWLSESGFIKGQAALQYQAPLRPDLTAKGQYTVENMRSVNDPTTGATTNNFHTEVHGNAAIANASHGFVQNVSTNDEWQTNLAALVSAVRELLQSAPEPLASAAEPVLAEIEQEGAGTRDKSKLQALWEKVSDFLTQTGSGAIANVLGDQAQVLLRQLP